MNFNKNNACPKIENKHIAFEFKKRKYFVIHGLCWKILLIMLKFSKL